ncbi:hypothetical protein BDV59DRAFT_196626 [Aspergillus ambiguus]|uniref:uncharacterized protein n=1 Tax=Aspergillus ambiguus TaxID=176160 RepID=UPI003CCCA3C2
MDPVVKVGLWRFLPSPFHLLCAGIYMISTGVCTVVKVGSRNEAGTRAAYLALINLIPLFLSGGYEFGARLLGVTLETYGVMHRTVGFTVVMEATIHIIIATESEQLGKAISDAQTYGIVCASILASLAFLPLVKKRVYDLFLKVHQASALAMLWTLWKHTQGSGKNKAWPLLLGCVALLGTSSLLQLVRILIRNIKSGNKPTMLKMQAYSGNIIRLALNPARPWVVRAGERVDLNVPRISLFSLFQKHPFTISWWENDVAGDAYSIYLLLRPRYGFTKKLLGRIEPEQAYRAWIDGPFGPASVSKTGLFEGMGDFGHVFMATTGIGIATQLPYIKELLDGRDKALIRTRRISLVWQLDEQGDWDSVRDWLQLLVKQDGGYLLNVCVYDALRPASTGDPRRIGHHDLIRVYGGAPDWERMLSTEMEQQTGRMLIAGKV